VHWHSHQRLSLCCSIDTLRLLVVAEAEEPRTVSEVPVLDVVSTRLYDEPGL
jgi:hypothetical protein